MCAPQWPSPAYDNPLDDWLTLRARTHTDRPALFDAGGALTYGDLDSVAAAVARRLVARGVRKGDRVATTLPAGRDFAALLHALPRLEAVLVPLNTRLTAAERRWQLEDARARVVVEEPVEGDEADLELRASVEPDAVQTLLYTSGTSGRPKPVELTYANHLASAIASAWNVGVAPDDRWLCVLPVFHVGGLAILLRSAVYGTAVVTHEGFDTAAVMRALAAGEATIVSLVPTMLQRLREAGLHSAPGLRVALLGGGPAPRGLLEWARACGLPVLQTYGMTETASQVATLSCEESLDHHGSVGRPLLGVELRIGERGEILVRGPMVARSAAGSNGWLSTGDRGHLDEDGFLHVEGRLDEIIVTGGEKVSASEVEEVLLSHPAVADVAVAGRPDPEWGMAVTAWVVVVTHVPDGELAAHCRGRLASFKVPKSFVRVDDLPRNAAGKVVRTRLRA